MGYLFQQVSIVQCLLPALIGLYNDIERTERPGAFYTKFQMRAVLKNVLAYVWTLPSHRWVCAGGGGAHRRPRHGTE